MIGRFVGDNVGGPLPSHVYRDLLDYVFLSALCVSPPLEVYCFWREIHMIFYVYITIISDRNKYRKISKSWQLC